MNHKNGLSGAPRAHMRTVARRVRPLAVAAALSLAAAAGAPPTAGAAQTTGTADTSETSDTSDPRRVVTLPPTVAVAFLAEMRGHMRTLDDIMMALADGDFEAAATIADLRLDFGHVMWESLADQGLSDQAIVDMKRAMREAGVGPGQAQGLGPGMGQGGGRGFGRYMPEDFRSMGRLFHQAGAELAVVARAVPADPGPADYATVIEAVQGVTGMCRACHDTFRVVPAE
ncbi:cytochrome c [Roseospira goensis]|uniref:Cytochrome c n=1 Tax=Roseospira goensis TaxID=391922 RepID=A0A7W6WJZ6_9PROT|nr:cytochrome c [Roseospira goensis]MBB4285224.1 hypothetical protein [Roseospira goensis]